MTLPKRTLVTGGAGFIGSHLCERMLADGHEFFVTENDVWLTDQVPPAYLAVAEN